MDEILIKLESMRKKAMTFVLITVVLIIAGFVLVNTVSFLAFPLIIAGVVFIFVSVKASKNFSCEYKSHIVSATLSEIFTDMQFSPKNGISCSTIDATGMMNTGDRFTSNDLITGKYNGVYHVLHGAISPMLGIGPGDIKLKEIFSDLKSCILCFKRIGKINNCQKCINANVFFSSEIITF